MDNRISLRDYLMKKLYKKANKIGLSNIEADALINIVSYILNSLEMKPEQIKDLPWEEKTSIVFKNDRAAVLNIYYSVFRDFNVPFNHSTVPYNKEFEENLLLGDMIEDLKDKVKKFSSI